MSKIAKDTKVQIEFLTESKRRVFLDCYVMNSEKDRLVMRFPPKGNEFLPYLTEGAPIKAFIYTYTGIWIINSMIIEAPEDNIITVEFKEEHQVIQRRKYFRIFYQTEFVVEVGAKEILAKTVDISGGGVRFLSSQTIKTGEQYNAILTLTPGEKPIPLIGRIFRKDPSKLEEYVFEYTAIIEKEREKIIQKCIFLERERNKKY